MSPEAMAVRAVRAEGLSEPPGATWSSGLLLGREIVLSGVTAGAGCGGDAQAQAGVIFQRLEAMLAAAGGGLRNIYKLVTYVTDRADKDKVNAARAAALRPLFPASTLLVVSGFAHPDVRVEIDAYANLDADLWAAAR